MQIMSNIFSDSTNVENNSNDAGRSLKLVVVGDKKVGKTCLLLRYVTNTFPGEEDYVPVVLDDQSIIHTVDGETITLTLVDTTVRDHNYGSSLRPLCYPQTDVFIICFSLVDDTSRENVGAKWIPELQRYCPDVPTIVVGTKHDLKENNELDFIGAHPVGRGAWARELGAASYHEVSSATGYCVSLVFDEAVRAALRHVPAKKNKKCVLV